LRLAIVNLTNGNLSGGYRKYVRELVPLIAQHDQVKELVVALPANAARAELDGIRLLRYPPRSHLTGFRGLVAQVMETRPDVVFIPTARWASFSGVPVVPMIRNMEPLTVPFGGNALSEGLKNLARARVAAASARRATRVIAVSAAVRDHIVGRWKLEPERVGVVHHGVNLPPMSRQLPAPTTELRRLADHPFLFTAGSIRPARGLEDAIRALAELRQIGLPTPLAVGGEITKSSGRYVDHLTQLAARLGVRGDLIWLGELDAEEMSWCLWNCRVFLMTSRAEACPNTLLEAMAHGALSVVTQLGANQELLGPEALTYPIGEHADLGRLLRQVLEFPPSVAAKYSLALRERSKTFSWRDASERTVAELENARVQWSKDSTR
jgi:glycosyltransferase involved in cell wall biosynthesis